MCCWLPDYFYGELNFPRRGCGSREQTGYTRLNRPCAIENIRIVWSNRRRKIGVIENIKDLSTELHVEAF